MKGVESKGDLDLPPTRPAAIHVTSDKLLPLQDSQGSHTKYEKRTINNLKGSFNILQDFTLKLYFVYQLMFTNNNGPITSLTKFSS